MSVKYAQGGSADAGEEIVGHTSGEVAHPLLFSLGTNKPRVEIAEKVFGYGRDEAPAVQKGQRKSEVEPALSGNSFQEKALEQGSGAEHKRHGPKGAEKDLLERGESPVMRQLFSRGKENIAHLNLVGAAFPAAVAHEAGKQNVM